MSLESSHDKYKCPFTRTVSVPISVKFTLTGRIGSEPNLSAKRSVTIDTMINIDSDGDGHGHGDGMCKRVLKCKGRRCAHS